MAESSLICVHIFPGSDQLDQVYRICDILEDPSDAYGFDMHGSRIGGGLWVQGNNLADAVGFRFPKVRSFLTGTGNF